MNKVNLCVSVFSLDSVITAVGLVDHLSIMVIAIVVSVGVMLVTSKWITAFLERNPTIKILALSFLLMIGITNPRESLGLRPGEALHCTHADEQAAGCGTYSMKFFGENILGGKVSFTSSETKSTLFRFSLPVIGDTQK